MYKRQRSHTERTRRIESGDLKVVGVNVFVETEESPLGGEENIMKVDPAVEAELIADVQAWRSARDNDAVKRSLDELRRVAETGTNIMPATIDLAGCGGTTGEWAGVLREVFGDILSSAEISASSSEQIVSSVNQQVSAFEQILITLKQISAGIDDFAASTKSTSGAAESLKETGDSLKESLSKYRVSQE